MNPEPVLTRELLARQFARLGVRPGEVVLTHGSMRALGWVCGGATAVVQALLDAVGPEGTVVVPAQTPDNRDPSRWSHRRVPEEWWPVIREHLPAFEPALTPSAGMGAIAERVRTWPGSARSGHPLTSFAAVGARAAEMMAVHDLRSLLGDRSPLAALERADARVLLLGVGFDKCTAFHLAESRIPDLPIIELTAVIRTARGREWVRYETAGLSDHDFGDLGADFEFASIVDGFLRQETVGAATGRLFPLRAAVRFARDWLAPRRHAHRPALSR
ncbi:aminoglycoside N(3)-acetyltransferase [Mangrovihabitans endophyticus]|uniref:Aminoglycoside N(3)-acetyltransferase n=1 Tax=Mangrovihabitans endophyticus TaxID=1751298 RepID=A0A8J3BT52_9ACTN|nr:AAC(3) family N-acetyltransferase [Mangrovihabitans endophyticus]GGK72193.1 AAC(3) family N-acetyltransferase [Mangrovihabitans endophyticus]